MEEKQQITLDDAMWLHAESIAKYGGTEGVRDIDGLASAVNRPLLHGPEKISIKMYLNKLLR